MLVRLWPGALGRNMSNQGGGENQPLYSMSDLGASLPPGSGGRCFYVVVIFLFLVSFHGSHVPHFVCTPGAHIFVCALGVRLSSFVDESFGGIGRGLLYPFLVACRMFLCLRSSRLWTQESGKIGYERSCRLSDKLIQISMHISGVEVFSCSPVGCHAPRELQGFFHYPISASEFLSGGWRPMFLFLDCLT